MAAPTIVGSATTTIDTDGGASSTVSVPASSAAGDVFVIRATSYNASGAATATGFVSLGTSNVTTGQRVDVTWLGRERDGSESGTFTVTLSGGSAYTYLECFIVRGADISGGSLANFLDSTAEVATDAAFATVAETTTVADCLILSGISSTDAPVSAQPSGYTSLTNLDGGYSAVAHKAQASAGSTGTDAWTGSGSNARIRQTLAIAPAAGVLSDVADTTLTLSTSSTDTAARVDVLDTTLALSTEVVDGLDLQVKNVVATATSDTTITVTWNPVTGATGYDIERDGTIIAFDHAASPYNDTGLTAATAYDYRVRAVMT